jgi:hypothetical protein
MEREVFDVYKTILHDTRELDKRREDLENRYITLMTFALAGDAYVAATSQLNNWLSVLVTSAIGLFGLATTRRYSRIVRDLVAVLNNRYVWLRNLESSPELARIGANALTDEFKQIYQYRDTGRSRRLSLQRIFSYSFVAVPLILGALTLSVGIPEIHQVIHPLTTGR